MERKMFITRNLKTKKAMKNVVFCVLLLKMCIVLGQDISTRKVIIIDPGHGGKDSGAIGINGIKEKEVVLNIAKHILKLNRTILNDRYSIYLTRYKDTLISLSDRSRLSKAIQPDIFISLHCNASKTYARGIEVYVHNSDKQNSKESIELALSLLTESTKQLGFKKRGVKFANFQVIREVISIPTVLIEAGFASNKDEADYFLKSKNINAIALALILGIYNFLNTEL